MLNGLVHIDLRKGSAMGKLMGKTTSSFNKCHFHDESSCDRINESGKIELLVNNGFGALCTDG